MMIALPPLLVPSTSAACLYNSLYLHPFCARIWKALNTLIAAAPFALALSETDAAISNHRLGAAQLAAALPNQHHAHWFCSLHQAQLAEGAVTNVINSAHKVVPRLYSLACLLKGTAHFSRSRWQRIPANTASCTIYSTGGKGTGTFKADPRWYSARPTP